MGPRIICPADIYKEHDDAEKALSEIERLKRRINLIKRYKDPTEKDIDQELHLLDTKLKFWQKMIVKIQKKFRNLDDVADLNKDYTVEKYIPAARLCGPKKRLIITT